MVHAPNISLPCCSIETPCTLKPAVQKTFYDIFDAAEGDEATGTCPHGYKAIHAQPGGFECLRLKAGQEKWASRFETRRCAPVLLGR